NKMMTFILNNVDPTYDFVEVVAVRYFSDDTGVQLHETWLVNMPYPIPPNPVPSDPLSMEVVITGKEDFVEFEQAELIDHTALDLACKSHLHINNRYYGANWKAAQKHHPAMEEYAKLITISYDDTLELPCDTIDRAGAKEEDQYTDYFKTYDNVGYFRGESYQYGLVFELQNGQLTDTFTTSGCDEYTGVPVLPNLPITNDDGIYRF